MDYFFDKSCTIYGTTVVNIDGEDTKSYSVIYTSIACDFYTPKNKYNKNNQAREFENENLEVVFSWVKDLIRKWQKITLVDSLWIDFGNYVIDDVIFWKNIYWVVDNTSLSVSQRDVG